ncbi:phosphoenolpyruvate carboxylase kinase 1-like [Senna tora]|uniref:Phosphoenolpyruvate carboxylase kinase 1-like n=1 Tax=Senna tora TaxID=362788 RepID=A0A834X2W0_9FABA|nr:phosphoenolpyruvate carboxylase kinase 1-like [Senna tora]
MSSELERDYVVLMEVGRGKFGTVYKCTSRSSDEDHQIFAVKSIDKQVVTAGDSLDAQCLFNEPKIMKLLSPHPNILTIHNVYEDDNHLHMVFDFCDHSDLHDRISATVPESDASRIMRQLMQAVCHCHRLGVAHRDIKPGNILFEGEPERLKLADFGSAEIFKEGEKMRGVVGTPYYVAPEVVGGREYNEKVDVWSAGVILYIMLSGGPPFDGETEVDIFEAVLRANLRFPSRFFHSVSPAAKDLLRRMLCKDISRRFSAEQVLRHPWFSIAESMARATAIRKASNRSDHDKYVKGAVLASTSVASSSASPDISSSDFPLDSGTKKVKIIPKKLTTPKVIRVFFTPMLSLAYTKPKAPTMAPAFPDAADMPWQVDLSLAGKISAGTTNVVALGPKLAKKKVNEYITTNPILLHCAAKSYEGLSSGNSVNFFQCTHGFGFRNPPNGREDVFLEQVLAVEGNVQKKPSGGGSQQVKAMTEKELP